MLFSFLNSSTSTLRFSGLDFKFWHNIGLYFKFWPNNNNNTSPGSTHTTACLWIMDSEHQDLKETKSLRSYPFEECYKLNRKLWKLKQEIDSHKNAHNDKATAICSIILWKERAWKTLSQLWRLWLYVWHKSDKVKTTLKIVAVGLTQEWQREKILDNGTTYQEHRKQMVAQKHVDTLP